MNIYMDGKKHIEENFKDSKERNRRARELRQDGWKVTCKKWDFTDLAREIIYTIEASR